MRLILASLLICALGSASAEGHDLSPAQKINKLHLRVLESNRRIDTLHLVSVVAYVTAAVASGAVCALYARQNAQDARLWFVVGLVVPIVAIPTAMWRYFRSGGATTRVDKDTGSAKDPAIP